MKAIRFAVLAIFASASIMGCAAESASVDEANEQVGETESAVTAGSAIVGKWEGEGGTIQNINFTTKPASSIGGGFVGSKFTATLDTGIRCITEPCPSQIEVTGIYKATATKVTLTAFDKPSREFAAILGTYKYTVSGDSLHLWNATRDESLHHMAPQCVEFEQTDDQGLALRNFTAENVTSYWAGKQIFANISNFTNEHINAGVCNKPQFCTKEYRPVCGSTDGGKAKTYGNLCEFKSAVRTAAGTTSSSQGHWEQGACAAGCTTDSDCTNGFCGADGNGGNACKAFSIVGESCEGFVLPAFQKRCAPGLTCVFHEATHDVPGTCQAIR